MVEKSSSVSVPQKMNSALIVSNGKIGFGQVDV